MQNDQSIKLIFQGEGSTVWRIFVPKRGTYDVTTYPGSELMMVIISGTNRRISSTQGRNLLPILREIIKEESERRAAETAA